MAPANPARQRLFYTLHFSVWTVLIPVFISLNVIAEVPVRLAVINGVSRQIVACVLTLVLWRIYRRWGPRGLTLRQVAAALALCLAATALEFGLIQSLRSVLGPTQLGANSLIWFGALVMRLSLYLVWSVLYFTLRHWIELRDRELTLARTDTATREAELTTLRAQVNPHFLFNALNSILAEADDNPRAVKSIAQALADYLRFSLGQQGHHVPLGEEIDALAGYLAVEQARFEERLVHTFVIAPEARRVLVPTAVVLPLVENAIKYGMRTSPAPLQVTITASRRGDRLHLCVENSGQWVEPRPGAPDSTQIGLANLRRRLALLHGDAAALSIHHDPDAVRIEVELPWEAPAA